MALGRRTCGTAVAAPCLGVPSRPPLNLGDKLTMPLSQVTTCLALTLSLAPSSAQPETPQPQPEPAHLLRFTDNTRSILQDSRGHYWFGSWNEGVAKYDGEHLTYFTTEDGLPDNQVRRILEAADGRVWFETGRGLSYADGREIFPIIDRDYLARDDWRLIPGALWFKGDEQTGYNESEGVAGVYRLDDGIPTFLTLPLPIDHELHGQHSVTHIATGPTGHLWISTYSAIVGFDGESFTVLDDHTLGLTEASGFLHARCVFEDSRGRVWIGNNGIGVLLCEDGEVTMFTQDMGVGRRDPRSGGSMTPRPGDAPEGAPTMHRVFSIGEDSAGNIWFGTIANGAWRYDGESLRNFTAADGLDTADILAISTDRRGNLWVTGHGVYQFNGESFERMH